MARSDGNFDVFFAKTDGVTMLAKTLCGICPVRIQCLDFAVRNRIKDGVWGGMTTTQRRRVARQQLKTEEALSNDLDEVFDDVLTALDG